MIEARPLLPERREPTHTLLVEIPLHVDEGQTFYFDPFKDAIHLVLGVGRIATIGVLCGDPQVSVREHE